MINEEQWGKIIGYGGRLLGLVVQPDPMFSGSTTFFLLKYFQFYFFPLNVFSFLLFNFIFHTVKRK
jgi:hypothetical protein